MNENYSKRKISFIVLISFIVFCFGLCSLLVGIIYEERSEILRELNDIYLSIMALGITDKIAVIIGTITFISFLIFVISFSIDIDKEDKCKEMK